MSIENDDSISLQTFSIPITIVAATPEEFAQQLSIFNNQAINPKLELTVVATGLDADVQLSLFQGNTETFSDMGAILDTETSIPIADTISNGSTSIIATTRFFFLGIELDPLTATTGTVTITGRA